MNAVEKKTFNLLQYGTPSPTIWQKWGLQKSIPIYEVLSNTDIDLKSYWTKAFSFANATKRQHVSEGYNRNLAVYSIINKISRVAAQSTWGVYTVKDQKAYQQYKSLQCRDYSPEQQFDLKRYRAKALELNERHPFNNVLQFPNDEQSGQEYMENLLGFKLLTGDCYEYGRIVSGGYPGQLWVLPSQFITIKNNGKFPMIETGYQLSFGANLINLKKEEVMHSKYWNPNWDASGNHLYGFSPLDAAWLSVLEDNYARESIVEILQNRGVRGIFTVESDKIAEYAKFVEMKGALQNEWQQNTKNYKDKIMPIFGRGQWHDVGLSVKDMSALEITGMTLKDLCNAYGVSDLLFNNQVASTKDNLKIARKDFITNCVLPLLNSIRDGRNRKMQKDWNRKGESIVVDYDATIYTELEADKKDTVEWMKAAGCFTDNEIRVQLNFEEAKYPYSDEPWKSSTELPVSLIEKDRIINTNPK